MGNKQSGMSSWISHDEMVRADQRHKKKGIVGYLFYKRDGLGKKPVAFTGTKEQFKELTKHLRNKDE